MYAAAERRARLWRAWRLVLLGAGAFLLVIATIVGVTAWNLTRTFDTETVKIPNAFPTEVNRPPKVDQEVTATPTPATPGPTAEPATPEPVAPEPAKAQNILLLGSDTRDSIRGSIADLSGQRADTIMVIHVPGNRENLQVMSIPRDSWLEIPGHGHAKINAALSYGGVPLIVQTIEGLLGVRIDHVAILDFSGFAGVADALGGVDVDNPIGFTSNTLAGHHFRTGVQHLDGPQALAFVRERYSFPDGDFQRMRNQQLVIKGLMNGLAQKDVLTDIAKMDKLMKAVAPYLAVDEGFTSAYLVDVGFGLRDLTASDVRFFTMPTKGLGTSRDQSIVNIDWSKLEAVQHAFQSDTLAAYQPEVQTMKGSAGPETRVAGSGG